MNENEKDIARISENEKEKYYLQNLANRPNAATSYGKGKLDAEGLKKLFDEQFKFLAAKHNLLVDGKDSIWAFLGDLAAALEAMEALFNETGKAKFIALHEAYPVGAIYMSISPTSPSILFGGEWVEIENGMFLRSGSGGSRGGTETHSHTLEGSYAKLYAGKYGNSVKIYYSEKDVGLYSANCAYEVKDSTEETGRFTNMSTGIEIAGNAGTSSNLPPYITVNMWKRIS